VTRYSNGYVPDSALITIATGTDSNGPWKHQGSPHIIALWRATQAYAQKKWGITPGIRTGWNIYRPYAIQVAARQRACALGNCLGAASPGYSSHGGTWINKGFTGGVWVDALAIDVDPRGLTWAQVWEAGRAAGFLCGAITAALAGIDEPWHIIDLDPWAPAPADSGSTPFPTEVDMPLTAADVALIWGYKGAGTTDAWQLLHDAITAASAQGITPAQIWAYAGAGTTDAWQTLNDAKTAAPTIDYAALAAAIVKAGGTAPTPDAIATAVRAKFASNPLA
jgi:hypothetical protein